ncbi:hypothetical protein RB2083_1179 [Rhodobacteraceae bacterium HTCC2083]|nr:hypothetical protein RB2083_1179 [Rhodobacteraceae bacterium HTCC2083]
MPDLTYTLVGQFISKILRILFLLDSLGLSAGAMFIGTSGDD